MKPNCIHIKPKKVKTGGPVSDNGGTKAVSDGCLAVQPLIHTKGNKKKGKKTVKGYDGEEKNMGQGQIHKKKAGLDRNKREYS